MLHLHYDNVMLMPYLSSILTLFFFKQPFAVRTSILAWLIWKLIVDVSGISQSLLLKSQINICPSFDLFCMSLIHWGLRGNTHTGTIWNVFMLLSQSRHKCCQLVSKRNWKQFLTNEHGGWNVQEPTFAGLWWVLVLHSYFVSWLAWQERVMPKLISSCAPHSCCLALSTYSNEIKLYFISKYDSDKGFSFFCWHIYIIFTYIKSLKRC